MIFGRMYSKDIVWKVNVILGNYLEK